MYLVHISLVALGKLAYFLFGSGVDGGESLSAHGVHPLVVDEELRELDLGLHFSLGFLVLVLSEVEI